MTEQEKILIDRLVKLQVELYCKAKFLKIRHIRTISEIQNILIDSEFVNFPNVLDNAMKLSEEKLDNYRMEEILLLKNDIKASSLADIRFGFKIPCMSKKEKLVAQYQVFEMFKELKKK